MPIRPFSNIKFDLKEERATLVSCMGIALLFWVIVKLSQTYDTERRVQIRYELPPEQAFLEMPPSEIEVTLKGRGWDLMSDFLAHTHPHIHIEIDKASHTIDRTQIIREVKKEVNSSVEVTKVNYDFIALNYELQIERKLPIQLNAILQFEPGYQYRDSLRLEPDSVLVRGPFSLIEPLKNWETDTLIIENLNADASRSLNLKVAEQGQISLNPSKIMAQIPVEQFTEKKLFIPVLAKNAPDSIRVFPAQIQVIFVVGLSRFDEIHADDFILEVDLKNISLNTENNTVPLLLSKQPTGIKGLNYIPQSVEFFIIRPNTTITDID